MSSAYNYWIATQEEPQLAQEFQVHRQRVDHWQEHEERAPEPPPSFASWLESRYHQMAGEYRRELWLTVKQMANYCSTFKLSEEQANGMREVLAAIPVPQLGKYPGAGTEADAEHFRNAHRPNFAEMLRSAQNEIMEWV